MRRGRRARRRSAMNRRWGSSRAERAGGRYSRRERGGGVRRCRFPPTWPPSFLSTATTHRTQFVSTLRSLKRFALVGLAGHWSSRYGSRFAHSWKRLEQMWQRALSYIQSIKGCLPLAHAAKASFDEYLLTLLLHHHPHNYSDDIAEPVPTSVPGLVRRAGRYIANNAQLPITVSQVAIEVGVSVRTLQAGFVKWAIHLPISS